MNLSKHSHLHSLTFLSCLSTSHSLLIILRVPTLSVFQTIQLDQQTSSYLSLVFKNDSTIIGITKTGQIIQHKLQFINQKFSIRQCDVIGEMNVDFLKSNSRSSRIGIEFDVHSLSSHLIIFTSQSFSVYQLFSSNLNRLLRYTLPPSNDNEDEEIIEVKFIRSSLISVLTKKSLKLYQLQSPTSEEDETKNKGWRLKLVHEFKGSYDSIVPYPNQEDDHEYSPKLLAFTDDQDGTQRILKLEPKSDPSVIYSSSSPASIETQSKMITCATWFDDNYELALIGDAFGQLTTQSFPSNNSTKHFSLLNETNNQLAGSIRTICVQEDQSVVIVGSSAGDIGIWQTDGTQLAWHILSDTSIESVEVMIQNEVFLAKTSDGSLIIFELKSSGLIQVIIRIPNLRRHGYFDQFWFNKTHPELRVLVRYCDGVKGFEYQVWMEKKRISSHSTLLEAQNQTPEEWVPIRISKNEQALDQRKLTIDLKKLVEVATTFYGPSASWISRLMIQELMPWGINERLDELVSNGLKISPTKKKNRLLIEGLKEEIGLGVNQTLHVVRLLVSLRLLLDDPSIERITGEVIEELTKTCGRFIDFGTLMKYWFNESIEIKVTIRNLFWSSLKSLTDQQVLEIVERWEKYLPLKEQDQELKGLKKEKKKETGWKMKGKGIFQRYDLKKMNSSESEIEGIEEESHETDGVEGGIEEVEEEVNEEVSARSMLLIGLILGDHYKLISTKTLKRLSISIFENLTSQSKLPSQIISLELCSSKSFEIIQHYIDAIELVRILFGLATRKGELERLGRMACLNVGIINPPLFITTLSYDLVTSDDPEDRIATMKLVIFMLRKKPLVLYTSLPRLVEAVVKSLDPTYQNEMRQQTQSVATIILHELVKTYPSIAFHHETQRLVVGTEEGACILYDLKTGRRLEVLESFKKPVIATSFSPDGHRLVTVGLEEGRVEVWKVGSGILSYFLPSVILNGNGNGMFGNPSTISNSSSSSGNGNGNESNFKPFKVFPFNVGEEGLMSRGAILEWVVIEWVTNRSCRLRIRESSLTFAC